MKVIQRIGPIFLVVGIVLSGVSAVWAVRTRAFLARAQPASGIVVDLETSRSSPSDGGKDKVHYHPVVRFELPSGEQRTFRSSFGSNPPRYAVGEEVAVLYDPADPGDAMIAGAPYGGPIVLAVLGAVFGTVGASILLVRRASARRAANLRSNGRAIVTRFQEVERNTSITVNGRSPWRIVSQWQDPATGLVHLFRSENLWFDPTPYLDRKELTVYVDGANYRRHHVDVSFLPKLAA